MLFNPPDEYLTDEDETYTIRYAYNAVRNWSQRTSPSYVLVARVLRDPFRRKAQRTRRFVSWRRSELAAVYTLLETYLQAHRRGEPYGEGYDELAGALFFDIREALTARWTLRP